jgi:hypothetical protein
LGINVPISGKSPIFLDDSDNGLVLLVSFFPHPATLQILEDDIRKVKIKNSISFLPPLENYA